MRKRTKSAVGSRQSAERSFCRLSRRAALRTMAGGALLLTAAGCGDDDDEQAVVSPEVRVDPTPDEVAEVEPTPTQEPIASPVAGYLTPDRWAGRTLAIASPGSGAYQEAQTQAFYDAFAEATGATVQQRPFDVVGRLRDQVDNDEVTWDVVIIPTEDVLSLSRENYLTPIDYNIVDRSALFDEVAMQYGVGAAFYSTVIVYQAAAEEVPSDWAAFWDVSRYGEGRALRRSPVGTLEFALLADGVPKDELYPLDIERAFASLNQIREQTIWYEEGKQSVELVASGEVALGSAWNVRAEMPDIYEIINVQWNGGMLSADSWVIPRGAPNADVAMDFINFATRAVPSANFSRLQPFGPVNEDAFALLKPERLAIMPNAPDHRDVQFIEGWNWWADNRESLTERFEDWLASDPPPVEATPAG